MALNSDFSRGDLEAMGWTDDTLAYIETEGFCVCRVTVVEKCSCASCEAGQRWFFCTDVIRRPVTIYAVGGDGGQPWPRHIKAIERDHPGCTFIY